MRIERALTLIQPWASLMALGQKKIETRSWSTAFRGWMAITASKAFPREYRDLMSREPFTTAMAGPEYPFSSDSGDLPRGAVVCIGRLYACRSTNEDWIESLADTERQFGNYAPNRYGWCFNDLRPLTKPVPCRGMQGLWGVSADLEARILEQLAE